MKKPHPRDYGFENESDVRLAITTEDQRKANISRVGLLSFLIAFCVSAPSAFLTLASMVSVPSLQGPGAPPLIQVLYMVFSTAAGFVLGLTIAFSARAFAERLWQPSTRYAKAKQYLDANWMWKQILQREYGYES